MHLDIEYLKSILNLTEILISTVLPSDYILLPAKISVS
jgi:hypothetical protein